MDSRINLLQSPMDYQFVDLKMAPVWSGIEYFDEENASLDKGKTF